MEISNSSSDSMTLPRREDHNEPDRLPLRKLISVVTLPVRFPLNFIRTRPWLSGVGILCVVMVYAVVFIPGATEKDDSRESFDFGLVTKHPDLKDQNPETFRRDETNSVISISGEQPTEGARQFNPKVGNRNQQLESNRDSILRASPSLFENKSSERDVVLNAQDGAWLTGNIETIDDSVLPKIVPEKKQKQHQIVLRPRIRK